MARAEPREGGEGGDTHATDILPGPTPAESITGSGSTCTFHPFQKRANPPISTSGVGKLSVKGQIRNSCGTAGHMGSVSVAIIQPCCFSAKAAINNS